MFVDTWLMVVQNATRKKRLVWVKLTFIKSGSSEILVFEHCPNGGQNCENVEDHVSNYSKILQKQLVFNDVRPSDLNFPYNNAIP